MQEAVKEVTETVQSDAVSSAVDLGDKVTSLVQYAGAVDVTDDTDYGMAGEVLIKVKAMLKVVKAYWKEPVKSAYDHHRLLKDREKEMTGPLQLAIDTVGGSMGRYQYRLEQERRQEEEMVRAAQQKEANASADEIATNLDTHGEHEMADAIRDNVPAVQPKVRSIAPKVKGTSVRNVYTFEIEDESKIPREFLMPDESLIRAYVNRRKEHARIAGVRVWSTKKVT